MKLTMEKIAGKLNPFPVMGKEAFVAFVKEWADYLKNEVKDYPESEITLPSPELFGKESYAGSLTLQKCDKSGRHSWDLAKIVGTCTNPHLTNISWPYEFVVRELNISPEESPDRNCFSIEYLKDFELSNIAVINFRNPNKDDNKKLSEIIERTKKMIYGRSALIQRGTFGGYTL